MKNKNNWSILNVFNTDWYTIPGEKFKICVPVHGPNTPGINVKVLWLDICSGRKFTDEKGIEHQINIGAQKWREAIPEEFISKKTGKKALLFQSLECSNYGLLRDKYTKKPSMMSDSNGKLRYKENSFSKAPSYICKKAFADSPEDLILIDKYSPDQYKYILSSPAKMDNPNKASCCPIIFDNGEVIYNERQYAFAITGIPNRNKHYPAGMVIDGHIFRYANEQETEEIRFMYINFRDNTVPELRDNRCHYDRSGNKGEVKITADTLVNFRNEE